MYWSYALEAWFAGNRGWGQSPHPLFPAISSPNLVRSNVIILKKITTSVVLEIVTLLKYKLSY